MDPEPRPAADIPSAADRATATDLIAAVEDALAAAQAAAPTAPAASFRDPVPAPAGPVGDALPVPQPGRPPMSQRATDASVVMLAAGAGTLMAGTGAGVALWALAGVDPVTLALAAGAPVAVVAALTRLVRRAGQAAQQAAPVTHHHTYAGPVTQTHTHRTHTQARGMFARSTTDARH
ncbi:MULTISPECIES: hypothetical protein [Streptomyces]|uniref:Uncharacterized protein n=2 Tax=Streptomyces TaxID=1883 RepID=A0ABU4KDT7_9ACTN|nr:hypothetical protein [Streptomyces roseolus]MDX2295876.1 hypothetical protein [Streptomyces roseolus]